MRKKRAFTMNVVALDMQQTYAETMWSFEASCQRQTVNFFNICT